MGVARHWMSMGRRENYCRHHGAVRGNAPSLHPAHKDNINKNTGGLTSKRRIRYGGSMQLQCMGRFGGVGFFLLGCFVLEAAAAPRTSFAITEYPGQPGGLGLRYALTVVDSEGRCQWTEYLDDRVTSLREVRVPAKEMAVAAGTLAEAVRTTAPPPADRGESEFLDERLEIYVTGSDGRAHFWTGEGKAMPVVQKWLAQMHERKDWRKQSRAGFWWLSIPLPPARAQAYERDGMLQRLTARDLGAHLPLAALLARPLFLQPLADLAGVRGILGAGFGPALTMVDVVHDRNAFSIRYVAGSDDR